ncbi:hypothetical protein CHS0354_015030 [Potamilus streckersoni]|uniref:IgGFc-binding protein N-terminal domain-containing protein n=1 Tax=Potamilus streckersoni TaxID=2493646 RepID=A0AAE0TH31_9BIVA|nr:hypothetical protein CHS0354_015030 [Potamilus streckersoni]
MDQYERSDGAGTLLYIVCTKDTTINVFAPYMKINRTRLFESSSAIPIYDQLMNIQTERTNKGVYITADKPISISVFEDVNNGLATEGYLAFPITSISTEYVVASDISDNRSISQFAIAALENSTIVNITLKTTGKVTIYGIKYSSGSVYSLAMSALDTFQVQHDYDLTGTLIQSNKPIAVFSGCRCGFGRQPGVTCQHEVEQIIPIRILGQEYITVPLFPAASYRYRIISPFDNTIVSIEEQNYALRSGDFMERWDTEPLYIHASKPIMVIEYGQCTPTYCVNGSDPSMITIPAISTFSNNITFGMPDILIGEIVQYHLLVVVETNMSQDLILDNKSIGLDGKYTVTTASRKHYTILVTNLTIGDHKLYHPDRSVRFGTVLYGTGRGSSIGFSLGYREDPSKPSVKFVPTGIQNIMLIVTVLRGRATGYEIRAESIADGNTYAQNGTFLQNQTTSSYTFSTTDLPGTCFNFRVVATTGSGQGVGYSDPVIEHNVCYGNNI